MSAQLHSITTSTCLPNYTVSQPVHVCPTTQYHNRYMFAQLHSITTSKTHSTLSLPLKPQIL